MVASGWAQAWVRGNKRSGLPGNLLAVTPFRDRHWEEPGLILNKGLINIGFGQGPASLRKLVSGQRLVTIFPMIYKVWGYVWECP